MFWVICYARLLCSKTVISLPLFLTVPFERCWLLITDPVSSYFIINLPTCFTYLFSVNVNSISILHLKETAVAKIIHTSLVESLLCYFLKVDLFKCRFLNLRKIQLFDVCCLFGSDAYYATFWRSLDVLFLTGSMSNLCVISLEYHAAFTDLIAYSMRIEKINFCTPNSCCMSMFYYRKLFWYSVVEGCSNWYNSQIQMPFYVPKHILIIVNRILY